MSRKDSKTFRKLKAKKRRHKTIRKRIYGTPEQPRLSVFRSLSNIYAQLIDDIDGKTIVSMSTIANDFEEKDAKTKIDRSFKVGEQLANKALNKGIEKIKFDRSGYKYHGRVKALADGARKAGLSF